ncbi:MAG: ABC transporter permease [Coriobacteriia bacterium]|nr:ABC transporter permease [Coriobacteriia bacterium]
MGKILNLTWLNLLELSKDRSGLLTLFALPLMLTFLFGTMMGGGERRITVAVADLDGTAISREVAGALDERSYALRRTDEQTARAMTASGEAAAAIIVPHGFEQDVLTGTDTGVTLVRDPRSTSSFAVAEAVRGRAERIAADAGTIRIVQGAFSDVERLTGTPQSRPQPDAIYQYATRLWTPDPPLAVREVAVSRSKVRGAATQAMGFQQYSLGFTLMFMLFMGLGSAGGFLDEREQGTLSRLLTTPTSKIVLVAGKLTGIYVCVIFQAAVMISVGVVAFNVPWGDDPFAVALIIGTFALAATGLGVMLSTLVRTRGQMSAITAIAATALSMLGGAYWPLDIVGPAMRTVAMLTPTGWAMTGLTDVVVRSQGLTQALVPSIVLAGMGAAFLAIGVARLKLE